MVDGDAALSAKFFVRQIYDFSKAWAFSFRGWGEDNGDTVNLRLETPTGKLLTSFPDGGPGFREVLIPMSRFNEVGIIGTRPDRSQITAILWTVFSAGTRRLDRVGVYESPMLRCIFVIRRSASLELKAGFTVRHPASPELKAGFSVS